MALTAGVVAVILWQVSGGLQRLLSLRHFYQPAPPRLTAIVNETARRMHLSVSPPSSRATS